MEVELIPRIVVLDCMDLLGTMEPKMPPFSLFSAIHIIYELGIHVAEILNTEIILALPCCLRSSEIALASAFYQSMRTDLHIVWSKNDVTPVEQMLMAHDG